ncbi:MAG: hypothetical protein LBR79_03415 [Oscillospiraceae bacterium]|nr:hypothetical protein [Oscillospiraceae bacterium]
MWVKLVDNIFFPARARGRDDLLTWIFFSDGSNWLVISFFPPAFGWGEKEGI